MDSVASSVHTYQLDNVICHSYNKALFFYLANTLFRFFSRAAGDFERRKKRRSSLKYSIPLLSAVITSPELAQPSSHWGREWTKQNDTSMVLQINCYPPSRESLSSATKNNERRLSIFLFLYQKCCGVEWRVSRVHLLKRLKTWTATRSISVSVQRWECKFSSTFHIYFLKDWLREFAQVSQTSKLQIS